MTQKDKEQECKKCGRVFGSVRCFDVDCPNNTPKIIMKKLLLKDLCGRFPYFTKVQIENEIVVLDSICDDDGYHFNFIGDNREGVNIEKIKPYLFPISSMTEEQKQFFNNLPIGIDKYGDISTKDDLSGNSLYTDLELYLEVIDWLNANHFDYRGLIEKGLAIDATNKHIY